MGTRQSSSSRRSAPADFGRFTSSAEPSRVAAGTLMDIPRDVMIDAAVVWGADHSNSASSSSSLLTSSSTSSSSAEGGATQIDDVEAAGDTEEENTNFLAYCGGWQTLVAQSKLAERRQQVLLCLLKRTGAFGSRCSDLVDELVRMRALAAPVGPNATGDGTGKGKGTGVGGESTKEPAREPVEGGASVDADAVGARGGAYGLNDIAWWSFGGKAGGAAMAVCSVNEPEFRRLFLQQREGRTLARPGRIPGLWSALGMEWNMGGADWLERRVKGQGASSLSSPASAASSLTSTSTLMEASEEAAEGGVAMDVIDEDKKSSNTDVSHLTMGPLFSAGDEGTSQVLAHLEDMVGTGHVEIVPAPTLQGAQGSENGILENDAQIYRISDRAMNGGRGRRGKGTMSVRGGAFAQHAAPMRAVKPWKERRCGHDVDTGKTRYG